MPVGLRLGMSLGPMTLPFKALLAPFSTTLRHDDDDQPWSVTLVFFYCGNTDSCCHVTTTSKKSPRNFTSLGPKIPTILLTNVERRRRDTLTRDLKHWPFKVSDKQGKPAIIEGFDNRVIDYLFKSYKLVPMSPRIFALSESSKRRPRVLTRFSLEDQRDDEQATQNGHR